MASATTVLVCAEKWVFYGGTTWAMEVCLGELNALGGEDGLEMGDF